MPRRVYLTLAVVACLLGGCSRPNANVKYRIAVIPKGLTHEFWQSIQRGAERAAADLARRASPSSIIWDGPRKESDAQRADRPRQPQVGTGINGLVLAPQDSKRMVPASSRRWTAGMPVVIIDSGLDRRRTLIVKYVATNNYNGGRMAAQHLLDVLAKDGKPAPRLVLFRYQSAPKAPSSARRASSITSTRQIEKQKKAGKPTITVLSTDNYAGATVDSGPERTPAPLLNQLQGRGRRHLRRQRVGRHRHAQRHAQPGA